MNAASTVSSYRRLSRQHLRITIVICVGALTLAFTPEVLAQPVITKVFTPNGIGPGSVSTITFTITNGSGSPVTGLTFSDVLPSAPGMMTIADPANASTTCTDGVVSAPDGGTSISLSDGSVGAFQSCTVTVDVTAGTVGTYTNPAITLSSSAGSSMSLAVDLSVASDRPGFSKSFAPSSIALGGRSVLTFTVDNTLNTSAAQLLTFSDNLPVGLVIADPANVSDTCDAVSTGVVSAIPGAGVIAYSNGSAAAAAACAISVDVVGTGVGMLDNVTGELTSSNGVSTRSSGKASNTLMVSVTPLAIIKSFSDDPVPPGGVATLELTIFNFDRSFSATGVSFTDDLTALVPALNGASFGALLSNDCNGPVTGIDGGTLLSLTGGSLAAGSSCSIRVVVSVPEGATPGAYDNTTSAVTATVDGSPIVGNAATDTLFVEPVPVFTKEFIDDPTTGGGTVTLRFTIRNTDPTSALTGIEFTDDIGGAPPPDNRNGALPGLAANGLVAANGLEPEPLVDPCGPGSLLTIPDPNDTLPSPPFPNLAPDPTLLVFSGGNLAVAGMPGDSCTFDVVLDVPAGTPSGTYLNTTSELAASPTGGSAASDGLIVIAAPSLTKAFTDDPVSAPATVTLEFTLSHPAEAIAEATGISFTDNLSAVLPGLTANLPPSPDPPCGPGSTLTGSSGNTVLTLTGGTLAPGQSCTFSVTLDVPMSATPAKYTNTTSDVNAIVAGLAVSSRAASDVLDVTGLTFSKAFLDDPVFAGEIVSLRFTVENIHPTDDATAIAFSDNLAAVLPGIPDLVAILPPSADTCGGVMSGPISLSYTGGSVIAGTSCTIELDVLVPAGTADGDYGNVTSTLTATQSGTTIVVEAVADVLTIDSNRLLLVKEFTDDPVAPGEQVTLELTLSNTDPNLAASAVAFSDDLGAALAGLSFDSVLLDTCGGTVSGEMTTMIDVSDVSLAASASCTLRLSLGVPGGAAAGVYINTTSGVTGTMGGFAAHGSAAQDELSVLRTLDFSASFDGPSAATGTAILSFTLTNPGNETVSSIQFSDDLDATLPGLVATSLPAAPCGEGSSISGISFLSFTGGVLEPTETCTFDVTVLVPASAPPGAYENVTSPLFSNGLQLSAPATATLTIEPPPAFGKTFTPAAVGLGLTSLLSFSIDNTASVLAANDLEFTDNLPAGILVASPPNAVTTCTGGTLTAVAGSASVSYTGGAVGAGASCTVQVDVVTAATGLFNNISGELTSSSGSSGTAQASLAVDPQPEFTKSFSPNQIAIGGTSTLSFVIANDLSTNAATGLDFSDALPAAVVIATPANASTDCTGGTLTAVDGTGTITYSGGTVAAFSSCAVQVDVTSSSSGTHQNVSGPLTSSLGSSGSASADLRVNPPPAFSKSFAPNPSTIGAVVTLSFTIDNTSSAATATDLDFTDVLPVALSVADPANVVNDCVGGTVTAIPGTSTVSYTGGSVNGESVCTLSVDVISSAAGDHQNTTGALSSSLGSSGTAEALLRVNPPPVFSKAFAPDTVSLGETSTLVLSVDNTASTADATDLNFTDTFPAEIAVADPANATTDCEGGALTAIAGAGAVSYTGGLVPAMSSCQVQVDVITETLGTHLNVTGELSSSLGPSGTAEASLTGVDDMGPVVTELSTAEGELVVCDSVRLPITRLDLSLTDDLTAILGADIGSNYLLVGSGPDGDFSTTGCAGGAAGDDVMIPVLDAVVADSDPLALQVQVVVADSAGLPAGLYRFFVCDTITDSAGNALDGDGNQTPGGDFELSFFRVDPRNLFTNAHFDDCPASLDSWEVTEVAPNSIDPGTVGTDDVAASPLSTSVRISQSAFDTTGIAQCADVAGTSIVNLEQWWRYDSVGALAIFVKACEYFDAAGCTGSSLGSSSVAVVLEPGNGSWQFWESALRVPVGAASASCTFEIGPLGSDPHFDLYLDGLFLGFGTSNLEIFSDGFESGDTDAWTAAVK